MRRKLTIGVRGCGVFVGGSAEARLITPAQARRYAEQFVRAADAAAAFAPDVEESSETAPAPAGGPGADAPGPDASGNS